MIKYDDTVSSQTTGQPIYGAQVTVLNLQGLQATIYSDEAGTIPLSQPILTDQSGYFSFYIDDGRYNVVVMAGQAELARTNITMVDTLGVKQRALLVPVNEDGGTIAPADARKGMVLAFDPVTGAPNAVAPNSFSGPPGPAGEGLAEVMEPTGASFVGYTQAGSGAIVRDGLEKLRETVSLRDFGADPTGVAGAASAFEAALAAGKRVVGAPGDVYLLERRVTVPSGRDIMGNGATLLIGSGVIGALALANERCKVAEWTIQGTGGGFAVLNTGFFNKFVDNVCVGDIGHFFFFTNARKVEATGNRVLGLTATTEITTAICGENSNDINVSNNIFDDVFTGWSVQFRNCQNFGITDNTIYQRQYSDTKVATAGQTVFNFNLGQKVLIDLVNGKGKVRIQLNGKPLSPKNRNGTTNYTIEGTGPTFTITFTTGRPAGQTVKLLGYRGAENIQVNNNSRDGVISDNRIDGGGDAGIIVIGQNIALGNNKIQNVGYAGIAIYGGSRRIAITGGIIKDCAQMDDAQSSPDDPSLPSPFAGAIFNAGEDVTVNGTVIENASATMQYGCLSIQYNTLRTDGSYGLRYTGVVFSGLPFSVGRFAFPNQTPGMRMNSISVDGAAVAYPAQIDIEAPWVTRANPNDAANPYSDPPSTPLWAVGGSAQTRVVRDTSITKGGGVSLQTVAGQFVEYTATRSALFRDCIVDVSFWARNAGGESYVHVVTVLAGQEAALVCPITETVWKQYTVSLPLTNDLDDSLRLRIGANFGSANVQHIQVTARRL